MARDTSEGWAAPRQSLEDPDDWDDDFTNIHGDFTNTPGFNGGVVVPTEQDGDQQQGGAQQHDADAFASQQPPIRLVEDCLPLVAATYLLSLLSFGFIAFYFVLVLRLPSDWSELPDGYDSWTSCLANSTRPAVTAIGHALPFSTARALTSVPKFIEVAFVCTLLGCLISGGRRRVACLNGLLVFLVAAVFSPVYGLAVILGVRALPFFLDPAVTLAMVTILTATHAVMVIRPRRWSTGAVARHPKAAFCMGMMILFGTHAVLVNLLGIMARGGANPGVVICVSIMFVRTIGHVARYIFRHINISIPACFALMFAYEVASVLSLRRYLLALPELADVVLASLVSAAMELLFIIASTVHAVRTYDSFVRVGSRELARVQISIFLSALVCDLIAEHVALHGGLGYNLFLDPRILTIHMQLDKRKAVEAWAVSLLVELGVDIVSVIPLIWLMPAGPNKILHRRLRSPTLALFGVFSCLHCHLIGLHAYLDEGRYFCQ